MSGSRRSIRPPGAVSPAVLLSTLDQRLTAAAALVLDPAELHHGLEHTGGASAHLLPRLVAACADPERVDVRWLTLTAAFGAFPTPQQVLDFGRMVELNDPMHAESTLLAEIVAQPRRGRLDLPMRTVSDAVVVEVNYCAKHATHTGIQRTVRETMPRWAALHDITAVAWADPWCAFRTLTPGEDRRVFEHAETPSAEPIAAAGAGARAGDPDESAYQPELVVPWRSSVVLPDVFSMNAKDQLAGMARFSGNTVSMIGYDLIPLTSPELRPVGEANGTAAYLSMVKHAHRVAGISRSAVAEFRGFSRSLRAQGLPGPEVREVRLSSEALRAGPSVASATRPRGERPVVLCLGAQEPHKNQRAALHAAERLWHEGLDFEVHLAGGRGWSDAVLKPAIDRLVAAGRPLLTLGRLSDADLLAEMRSADFAYFASLHEGYGLPVAETLACGTPVITANFGSQAEIGELGGCLLIDPRDDDDVTAGIRTLLTDRDELARLRAEATALTLRTWDEYAADLWDFVSPTGGHA
jgi:glycosyltransferase involved in cell wall biosynthesis